MKKHLLTALLSLSIFLPACAQSFDVVNHLGIHCINHTREQNETLYRIAQKYFVRPSTLALVNNIDDAERINSLKKVFIPLTETNYYNMVGLKSSKFTFEPILYKVQNETEWTEVAAPFFITVKDLKQWNEDNSTVAPGNKLIVGWLKYEKTPKNKKAPLFVQKEKIKFGTLREQEEARSEMRSNKVANRTKVDFPNYSIRQSVSSSKSDVVIHEKKEATIEEFKTVPIKKKEVLEARVVKLPQKKVVRKKNLEWVRADKKEKKREAKKITNEEKNFLASKEINKKPQTKQAKKQGFWSSVKKLTKNSYARDKERTASQSRETLNPTTPSIPKVVKKVKKPKVFTEKVELKTKVKAPIKVVTKTEKKTTEKLIVNTTKGANNKAVKVDKSTKETKSDKPLYIESKLLKLTLLKSMKGRASFFYSGTAGAKFYAFTNLAGKGGIIKLTNLNNKKYILAQVIGPLSETDRKKGNVVKLSDNCRRIIGVTSKSFSAKVNY